jgi:hypothetical protein
MELFTIAGRLMGKPSAMAGWRSRLAAELDDAGGLCGAGCDIATNRHDVHLLKAYS